MKNRNYNLKRYQVKVEKKNLFGWFSKKIKLVKKIYCNASNCIWYLKIIRNAHTMSKHYVKSKKNIWYKFNGKI